MDIISIFSQGMGPCGEFAGLFPAIQYIRNRKQCWRNSENDSETEFLRSESDRF